MLNLAFKVHLISDHSNEYNEKNRIFFGLADLQKRILHRFLLLKKSIQKYNILKLLDWIFLAKKARNREIKNISIKFKL